MKKIISLFLTIIILLTFIPVTFAQEAVWEAEYRRIITSSNASGFVLVDVTGDGMPELFSDNYGKVFSFYYKDGAAIAASENKDVPFVFFKNLKYVQDTEKDVFYYMGQAVFGQLLYTYKMSFPGNVPVLEVIAQENLFTGAGNFKGDADVFSNTAQMSETVAEYLKKFAADYLNVVSITPDEIHTFGRNGAVTRAFKRYNFLNSISDDTMNFSSAQREKIKRSVALGNFREFSRISILSDTKVFVEFFVNDSNSEKMEFPYSKQWALLDGDLLQTKYYTGEKDLDAENLMGLIAAENVPSNVTPDYGRCASFRGIDDYVNYLSSLVSVSGGVNENGKKVVAQFMEYAVNKCSRAALKAHDNTLTVTKDAVSIIAENGAICMGQLVSVCNSKNISQIRTARTIPELVCKGVDLKSPVRIEFQEGVSEALSSVSGLRISLDGEHSIYVNTAELAILEENTDTFSIEYTKNDEDYSIVFTDRNNRPADSIAAPVWFVVPAKYEYSTVIASNKGATDNRGGQFDERNGTIEFSALRSGNYQVVENDVTINDAEDVSLSRNEAIRFLVSKGVFTLDKKKNFYPRTNLTKYDFTMALVKMFYNIDEEAQVSFPDIKEGNKYYEYIATAEKLNLTKADEKGNFGGKTAVTKEHLLALCGKVLADRKGYQYPDNFLEYLQFTDKEEISSEAMGYIAIAVQCGLVENTGEFSPKTPVTREEGAEFLYRTYMLLYDASAVTTSLSSVISSLEVPEPAKDLGALSRVLMCVGVTVIFLSGITIVGKVKKKHK